jgi:protein-tyrosine phosphatase
MPWETLWIRWPDFRVPTDPDRAVAVLRSAYDRLTSERVEAACDGGIGRTGTILAAWCVIDGLTPDAAVAHVRAGYHPRAVETPWQRRFLWRLAP